MASDYPKKFPVFFQPHKPLENVNYIRHITKEWDIGKLQSPIYLYQPTVKPNADGGVVIEKDNRRLKNNKEFIDVRKEFIKKPEEEPWYMHSSDGRMFKGQADTLSHTNQAVLSFDNSKFTLQLIDQSIRVKDEKILDANKDIDVVLKQMKRTEERTSNLIEKTLPTIYRDIEKEKKMRIRQAKELLEAGGEDGIDEDSDLDDEDGEGGADVVDQKSDDEEIDPEEFFSDVPEITDDEDSFSEEEDEKKDKKDKPKPKPKEDASAENMAGKTNEERSRDIVNSIMGEECVKEDELIQYMLDVGAATGKELLTKFNSKLKTQEQKSAFKLLISKMLITYKIRDKPYFKLRSKNR